MFMLFCDFNRPILKYYHECGQTVNTEQYCAKLEEQMKHAICSKYRGMLTNRVLLHHDNT